MIVVASGYFDPIHFGHIEYLQKAKALAGHNGRLVVIVNSDEQAVKKKGYVVMPLAERVKILCALRDVDEVVTSIDTDATVCKTIQAISLMHDIDVFAKGGDRFAKEIPEAKICKKYHISIVDGLGDKIQSSSDLIKVAAEKIK